MNDQAAFRGGDVVLAAVPFVGQPGQGKLRPAVVAQNDVGNRFSPNLIVVPISSQVAARQYPTNVILRRDSRDLEGTGLSRDSVVHAETIFTLPKTGVARRIGRMNRTSMQAVDEALHVSLGLA